MAPRRRQTKSKERTQRPTNAEELRNFEQLDAQEVTSKEVEKIFNILKEAYEEDNSPICFFEFVINPESFSRTVENIFNCSFLVRDGRVAVSLDDDNFPVIKPCDSERGTKKQKLETNQVALSITQPQWRKCVEAFKIRYPMIPVQSISRSQSSHEQRQHSGKKGVIA
ncbi:hypothetical protein CAPTEDRAFT_198996 [Capitella teleta]|uniref:Non-structural maintenance of chromosomes element 4 n=1 Tax=Capitella teleta TaxID=283909 RepID=R7TQC2_CAPTE|nr:hypothetical protein CAPTEDRAFT_198996 [Capitella teleta]|eukprot:ELT95762.1 hypothetical protein CAPTEDRAFT_198996 [Capitella teleta]